MENLPNTLFRVKISTAEMADKLILCHLAGKMRINHIRILPGDKVKCQINTLDTTRGRIILKIRN